MKKAFFVEILEFSNILWGVRFNAGFYAFFDDPEKIVNIGECFGDCPALGFARFPLKKFTVILEAFIVL